MEVTHIIPFYVRNRQFLVEVLRDGGLAAAGGPGDDPNVTVLVWRLHVSIHPTHMVRSVMHWCCRAVKAWSFLGG